MEMFDFAELSAKVNEAYSMLDAEAFPETMSYLASIMGADGTVSEEPYEIATQVMLCDKLQEFPKFMIDFVAELYKAEIVAGNSEAMNDLGAHYYGGNHGFPQDFTKAVAYYKQAAANGSRQAQENLGYCYYYGRDMKKDYEKAFHYFALGAFDGHLISLYKIGDMYLNGYYVEKNEKEAFAIYMRCLNTMTDEAAPEAAGPVFLRIGNMLLNGLGTEADAKGALICYQKAESFLYDMVKNGDVMYKKSLQAAIDGQTKARAKLSLELPDNDWSIKD